MKRHLFALVITAFAAQSAAAQSDPQSTQAAKVEIKVNATLAQSVKISGDSAMKLARANANWGEVSSAELEMLDKRLVYEVKVLNKSKRATEVVVDAMSGEVLTSKQYGGLKATLVHHKQNKKLKEAKKDSVATSPR